MKKTFVACLCAAFPSIAMAQDFITVASTTSTEQSGLFKHLLPEAKKALGFDIRVTEDTSDKFRRLVIEGWGKMITTVDMHGMPRPHLMRVVDGVKRYEVMYNDFVIVGPKGDPAGAKGNDVVAALKKIAAAGSPFASRGDKSGTDAAEKRYWKEARMEPWTQAPKPAWYRETGSGMGPTLNTAAGMNAYALADRGTWLSFRNRGDLAILVEGDTKLFNQYGVMLVNPAKHPHVKKEMGQKLIDWLISPAGQAAIAAYRINGQQLFFPNAKPGA